MLRSAVVVFLGFSNTIALLADAVPTFAVPQRVHYGVFALGVASGTENFGGVTVAVVAVAVAAELFIF